MLKYEKLIEKLRERLAREEGDGRLPPLSVLAREEGLSLNTVHHAIQELKKEGLIVTRTGLGTFVRRLAPFDSGPPVERSGSIPRGLPLRMIAFTSSIRHVFEDPFGETVFKGFEKIFAEDGSSRPIQFHGGKVLGKLIPLPQEAAAQRVCGTVCLAPFNAQYLSNLAAQCRPIVSIDRDATAWGIDSIMLDNAAGAVLATEHLYKLGHREIAFAGSGLLSADENGVDTAFLERAEGFRLAHVVHSLPLRPELMVPVKSTLHGDIDEALRGFLQRKERFTAMVAYDHGTALRALEMLKAAGISVPRDCSVVHCAALQSEDRQVSGPLYDIGDLAPRAWSLLERAWSRKAGSNPERQLIPPHFENHCTTAHKQKG